jgi:glucan phosphoethanolaminetransferase (alkaline phosphatase superfamily)
MDCHTHADSLSKPAPGLGLSFAAIGGILLTAAMLVWSFSTYYSSFFREHKDIQHYSNPASYLNSAFHLVREQLKHKPAPPHPPRPRGDGNHGL